MFMEIFLIKQIFLVDFTVDKFVVLSYSSPNTITQQHTFEDKLKVESCAAYGVINEMKVMSPRESEETL